MLSVFAGYGLCHVVATLNRRIERAAAGVCQFFLCCCCCCCCGAGTPEDWDPAEGLAPQQLADMERDYLEQLQRRRQSEGPPRDKWITPLLDWQVG